MSNFSNFQTQRNQTIHKTKQQLNFKATRIIQDLVAALIKFTKQMLAAVLGK